MPKPNKDKRQFNRLKSYCLIRYAKIGDRQNPEGKTTNMRNISEGGLLFTAYEPLPISSVLKVTINLPGREKTLESYAKVMRCTKASEDEEVYHVGISFLDIPENDREEISSHIDQAAHDKIGKKLIQKHRWWQFWRRKKIKAIPIPGTKGAFLKLDDKKENE